MKLEINLQDILFNVLQRRKEAPHLSSTQDDSIIDITDISTTSPRSPLKFYSVPHWSKQYVYEYEEIHQASKEQQEFYVIFKQGFLVGEHIDLKGYLNYAFILLFDLLHEYETHQDSSKLETQLKILGNHYPKTKSYAVNFLIDIMESNNDWTGASRVRLENNRYAHPIYEDPRLGSRYQTKLQLNEEEVKLLNRFWVSNNNFTKIEACQLEVIKLYIAVIPNLISQYHEKGTKIETEFNEVADIVARKHFRYRTGSQNYNFCIKSLKDEFYTIILKLCENKLREVYQHKRKLTIDILNTTVAKLAFESKIGNYVSDILSTLSSQITPANEATEIELNAINLIRWKSEFEELKTSYTDNPKNFYETILRLGKLNEKNPHQKNIYLEASKFLSSQDSVLSLSLYIQYVYICIQSNQPDFKPLSKAIQKCLFQTAEQTTCFVGIINILIQEKDLEKAIQSIPTIYAVKRKKIELNASTIQEVQEQHKGTVELLNEYLQDEEENESHRIQSVIMNKDELQLNVAQKNSKSQPSAFLLELNLSLIQEEVLELFRKANLSLSQEDLDLFVKSKSVFKNQLIESINDACYETLDDVLIEEEGEDFTINPIYFQKISVI